MDTKNNFDSYFKDYLLNRLPKKEKKALEELYITNEEAYEKLLLKEQELIDDYIKGQLSPEEKNLFERDFLSSRKLSEKFEFVSDLNLFLKNQKMKQPAEKSIIIQRNKYLTILDSFEIPISSYIFQAIKGFDGVVIFSSIALALIFLIPQFKHAFNFLPTKGDFPFLHLIQILVILYLIYRIVFVFRPNYYSAIIDTSLGVLRFWKWWISVWAIWLILYISLLFMDIFSLKYPIIFNFLNNLQTFVFLGCFLILAEPFETYQNGNEKAPRKVPWRLAIIILLLSVGELVVLYRFPNYPKENFSFILIFGSISGGFACVSYALLIGRLGGRRLGIPKRILAILYFYAFIQAIVAVIYPLSEFNIPINQIQVYTYFKNLLFIFALISKVLLYYTITWLINTNRLHYYMEIVDKLDPWLEKNRFLFLRKLID